MPFTLIPETGAGLSTANAFGSLAQVTAVLDASPFADAWAGEDEAKQNRCIAEASAWLSRLGWDGIPTTTTQALAFPRSWMSTPEGLAIASNLIPAWLVQATARLAFWLSQQDDSPFADSGLAPNTELALPGGLRLTPQSSNTKLPPDVRQLVGPYLRGGSSLVRA
jgi:hypothetical protein